MQEDYTRNFKSVCDRLKDSIMVESMFSQGKLSSTHTYNFKEVSERTVDPRPPRELKIFGVKKQQNGELKIKVRVLLFYQVPTFARFLV